MSHATSKIRSRGALARLARIAAAALLVAGMAATAWAQQESLGDYARRLRAQKKVEVLISDQDADELFQSVDRITQFSSEDSGLPRRAPVKRKLIGHDEAEKHFAKQSEQETRHQHRIAESIVVLKKFGILPGDFDLSKELRKSTVDALAGFYDFSDQTMYLLNWIPPELQKAVMAHELTHALQDQNYHLAKFLGHPDDDPNARQMSMQRADHSEGYIARRAVMEGQATMVGNDYELKDKGVSLADSAEARQRAISFLEASYDPPVQILGAPRLLRETMLFPYREGLIFELRVLSERGRKGAFEEVLEQPPVDTHQILEPEAYLKHEASPRVTIPDLSSVFGTAYEAYDSGTVGEFDVQIMSQQFGRENDIFSVARQWDGGSYVAVRRAGLAAGSAPTTSDLALVYLSRWKSPEAARRFVQIYLDAMAKRLPMGAWSEHACKAAPCAGPLWERSAASSEGPVHAELWPGNLLLITQSVADARMPALRAAVLSAAEEAPENRKSAAQRELVPRLFAVPEFQALAAREGMALSRALERELTH